MKEIEKLNKWIKECNNIVFFGGAGVSTESGIPDFRGENGIYKNKYTYPPEEILSHTFFLNHTNEFYQFYFDKMIYPDKLPNDCHKKLVELEKKKKLKYIITQNIDGLHQKAGSKSVLELHGNINKNYCSLCNKQYSLEYMLKHKNIPKCSCGGIIKPAVTLYEEELDYTVLKKSIKAIKECDLLIIVGTSLNVYPAAGLIQYFKGKYLVLINKEKTAYDYSANLIIHDNIGEVFKKITV